MNFVFLMDPLDTVDVKKDTTFALMEGAARKKHKSFYLDKSGIFIKNGKVYFRVIPVTPDKKLTPPFKVRKEEILKSEDVDVIFIRTNPPFDGDYLLKTWLFDLLPSKVKFLNSPSGIRTVNEKLWLLRFKDIVPPTLISRKMCDFKSFVDGHKEVIAKPTDGFGGMNVFYLSRGHKNNNVILESLSARGEKDIILQKYIPESKKGDKRILLLNGDYLGAVLRVHSKEDHRNNFLAGGKPVKTRITGNDEKIIDILKPYLRQLGLYFVGIDIIGSYLTEVNVTSPTCLVEMNRLHNTKLEDKVINFVEKNICRKS